MKPFFIIAHKYIGGYESYLSHYLGNIKKYYPESTIIIVDNNSVDKNPMLNDLPDNVIVIENDVESKFELGAYQVGLGYMISNDIVKDSDYVVFTQDTYILKNPIDFEYLYNENHLSFPLNDMHPYGCQDSFGDVAIPILSKIGLMDGYNIGVNKKMTHCWCTSFIVHKSKLFKLYEYLQKIVIKTRYESEASERYFTRILYELNGGEHYSLDKNVESHYNPKTIDPTQDFNHGHFVKKKQQKNEHTKPK